MGESPCSGDGRGLENNLRQDSDLLQQSDAIFEKPYQQGFLFTVFGCLCAADKMVL